MRALSALVIAAALSFPAYAEEDCPPEHLSPSDVAIIASALGNAPTVVADNGPVLYGEVAAYGQVGPEDASQMAAVVPEGAKVVYCPIEGPHHN